jgi:hypothetical protein
MFDESIRLVAFGWGVRYNGAIPFHFSGVLLKGHEQSGSTK